MGGRHARPRSAARLGGSGGRPVGTRRHDRLPGPRARPHRRAARLGAVDPRAPPRRTGEHLAGGPSAIRLAAVQNERGDQRAAHARATEALLRAGATTRRPPTIRPPGAVGRAETTTLKGEVLLQREPTPESKEVVRDGRCGTGSLTEGPVLLSACGRVGA